MALAPEDIYLQQIGQLHEYLRTTGQITTAWFFFACPVNAAVAGWFVQTRRAERVKVMPAMFIACDLALAFMYAIMVPLYYWLTLGQIASLTWRLRDTVKFEELPIAFPFMYWVATSLVLAVICDAMAGAWWFFFFSRLGRKRVRKFMG